MLRQWEMLRMLTVARTSSKLDGRWDRASTIARRLAEAGYDVSVRTVQRDLKQLSVIFPIELNDKNPRDYGWRWISGASLDIPGMSVSEALAMRLVEMHMTALLPASMLHGLRGIFDRAEATLDQLQKESGNPSKQWLDKIRVVPPAQPMLPPDLDSEIQAEIYQAVLSKRQLTASYRPVHHEKGQELILHPHGLILRGPVTYLVATAWNYEDVRLYAVHRFDRAVMLDAAATVSAKFSLEQALTNGLAEFTKKEKPIRLELLCSSELAAYLAETKLSADQKIEPAGSEWQRVSATVNDAWQLRWWILSQGPAVKVIAPSALRAEIMKNLSTTIRHYETKTTHQ